MTDSWLKYLGFIYPWLVLQFLFSKGWFCAKEISDNVIESLEQEIEYPPHLQSLFVTSHHRLINTALVVIQHKIAF